MKKKNLIFNSIMVLAILALCISSFMFVGNTLGWFVSSEILAEDALGHVTLTRSKVASPLKSGTELQEGDEIETGAGGTVTLTLDEDIHLFLNQETTVQLKESQNKGERMVVLQEGELFCLLGGDHPKDGTFSVTSGNRVITAQGTIFSVSAASKVITVNVFEGSTQLAVHQNNQDVQAGEQGTILSNTDNEEIHVEALTAETLNEFIIHQALAAGGERSLCFTEQELKRVLAAREAEAAIAQAEAQTASTDTTSQEAHTDSTPSEETGQSKDSTDTQNPSQGTGLGTGSREPSKDTGSSSGNSKPSKDTSSGKDGPKEEPPGLTATITIRCDTILDNMEDLAPGKEKFVPPSGVILSATKVKFQEGETVFDVLKRITSAKGIHLAHKYFPVYESAYIQGINQLYEFDCGPESGWMYKVNGWFPNYGVSKYQLKDGDTIVFAYTSKGLGADLGAKM